MPVEDIGIVENGKLACTANWGMLDKPRRFPPKICRAKWL